MFSPKSIVSIDIETTGLDPGKVIPGSDIESRIWSYGAATKNKSGNYTSSEIIFNTKSRYKEWDVLKDSPFYGKNEAAIDYFSASNDDLKKSGKIIFDMPEDVTEYKKQLSKNVNDFNNIHGYSKQRGMILIQNSAFERRWLGNSHNNEAIDIISQLSEYSMINDQKSKSLYRPADVTNILNDIKATSDIAKKDKLYDAMMAAYQKADIDAHAHGKTYVADLMDFTRATFTKAAAQGHIDQSFTRYGHNVDFLSKLLLKEPEAHSAASDALQQVKIFDKLMEIHGELSSGKISENTKELFDKMNSVKNLLKEEMGAKSMLSNIEKLENTGQLDASIRHGLREYEVTSDIDGTTKKVIVSGSQKLYDQDEAFLKVAGEVNQYSGSTASDRMREIQNEGVDTSDKINRLKNKELKEDLMNSKNKASEVMDSILLGTEINADDAAYLESLNNKNTERKLLSGRLDDFYHEKIKTLPIIGEYLPNKPLHGYVALGAAALGAGYAIFSDSSNDKEVVQNIKDRQARLRENQYSEDVFRKYEGGIYFPTMQVGQPNADWGNRIRHHEYQ